MTGRESWVLGRGSWLFLLGALFIAHAPKRLSAQAPLEDNSFLVEEAYNQPSRVVQHISTAELHHGSAGFSFTQEWPFKGQRDQLSYTLFAEDDDGFEMGDVALNYRRQVLGKEGADLWMAPRLSLILPVGDASKLGGNGGTGVEAMLPVSWEVAKRLTLHGNLGAAWRPSAENGAGQSAATLEPKAGVSAIFFITPLVNLLAESVWVREQGVVGNDQTASTTVQSVTLGARVGFDLPGGVQVVPGVAWMPAVDDVPTRSFVYLSIEHGF